MIRFSRLSLVLAITAIVCASCDSSVVSLPASVAVRVARFGIPTQFTIPISNTGVHPARIEARGVSCSCVSPRFQTIVVPPGTTVEAPFLVYMDAGQGKAQAVMLGVNGEVRAVAVEISLGSSARIAPRLAVVNLSATAEEVLGVFQIDLAASETLRPDDVAIVGEAGVANLVKPILREWQAGELPGHKSFLLDLRIPPSYRGAHLLRVTIGGSLHVRAEGWLTLSRLWSSKGRD